MYYWRYTFYPRIVKEQQANTSEYEEIYYNLVKDNNIFLVFFKI